jgi:hypothetical protein
MLDNPRLLPFIFFTSLLLVGLHVAIEQGLQRLPLLFGTRTVGWESASIVFVALAVAFPVLGAGIRTWRSARETTRLLARSAARRRMLMEFVPLLEQLESAEVPHALCQLQALELVLESDQREWLRLKREVEWYR